MKLKGSLNSVDFEMNMEETVAQSTEEIIYRVRAFDNLNVDTFVRIDIIGGALLYSIRVTFTFTKSTIMV